MFECMGNSFLSGALITHKKWEYLNIKVKKKKQKE